MSHLFSARRKRRSSSGRKPKSSAQKAHIRKASIAMKLFRSGKARSLKEAWNIVKRKY